MHALTFDPQDWTVAAACRGEGALFFAPDVLEAKAERKRRENAAKAICRSCPVRQLCLEEALTEHERFGIWGGLTERERRSQIARRTRSPHDIVAGSGRPPSLPAVVVQGRPMSPSFTDDEAGNS